MRRSWCDPKAGLVVFALVATGGAAGQQTPAPAPAAPGCAESLAALAKAYRGLGTLTAHFRHTLEAKTLNQTEVEEGMLYLAPGGKMRWQYLQPKGKLAVSDGKETWLYLASERQVVVQPLARGAGAPVALRLLAGEVDVAREFACQGAERSGGKTTLKLSLVPPAPGVEGLEVRLDPESGLVDRVSYRDSLGNAITLELSEIRTGAVLDPGMFLFQPPRGVQVIRPAGGS